MNVFNTFFRKNNLQRAFLLGYYGDGNFGDELLLETVLALLRCHQPSARISIFYLHPKLFASYHNTVPHRLVPGRSKMTVVKHLIQSPHIIIGGGGLWSADANINIFLMSAALLAVRLLLRKKISLLGVGFYTSANMLGAIAGYMAGLSATTIIARDKESANNFKKVHANVILDTDLAMHLPESEYLQNPTLSNTSLSVLFPHSSAKTVLFCPRHTKKDNTYCNRIVESISKTTKRDLHYIILDLEPSNKELYEPFREKFRSLAKHQEHVTYITWHQHPLALIAQLNRHKKTLIGIGPQYHIQLIFHKLGIPFMPLTYDNKCTILMESLGLNPPKNIQTLTTDDIQHFIRMHYH